MTTRLTGASSDPERLLLRRLLVEVVGEGEHPAVAARLESLHLEAVLPGLEATALDGLLAGALQRVGRDRGLVQPEADGDALPPRLGRDLADRIGDGVLADHDRPLHPDVLVRDADVLVAAGVREGVRERRPLVLEARAPGFRLVPVRRAGVAAVAPGPVDGVADGDRLARRSEAEVRGDVDARRGGRRGAGRDEREEGGEWRQKKAV